MISGVQHACSEVTTNQLQCSSQNRLATSAKARDNRVCLSLHDNCTWSLQHCTLQTVTRTAAADPDLQLLWWQHNCTVCATRCLCSSTNCEAYQTSWKLVGLVNIRSESNPIDWSKRCFCCRIFHTEFVHDCNNLEFACYATKLQITHTIVKIGITELRILTFWNLHSLD